MGWWRRAEAYCQQLGARPELGRTLAEAGRALSTGLAGDLAGRDGAACLAEANAIFEALDLRFDRMQYAGET
jgi:hypothetical protein